MKKITALVISFFLFPLTAHSAPRASHAEFGNILNDSIAKYGIGTNGVIYASEEAFYYGREMLFICRIEDDRLLCSVYDINDGAECIDTLTIELNKNENSTFSIIKYDNMSYLLLSRASGKEFFALLDDSFTHIPEITYSEKTDVVKFSNGKPDTLSNTDRNIYNFLNAYRLETIASYPYMNKVNIIDGGLYTRITQFLTACAAITEYDRANYDYDRIFKYVLYTHTHFADIVNINPHSSLDGDIKSVSSDYIDYIMIDILGITPEHPEATALTERGFCYRDGVYLYTGSFSAEYSTEILELSAIHDLGAGIYHVVFSDIYSENGKDIPEYSFAVIHDSGDNLSLLRLGMGKNLLTPNQISRYASISNLTTPAWEKDTVSTESAPKNINAVNIAISAAAAAFAAAAVIILLFVLRRRKH